MTLYGSHCSDAHIAALRQTAGADVSVVDLATLDALPMELTARDRIAVPFGDLLALLGILRTRTYPTGLDVLAITPTVMTLPIALEPIDRVAITYITDDELMRLPA